MVLGGVNLLAAIQRQPEAFFCAALDDVNDARVADPPLGVHTGRREDRPLCFWPLIEALATARDAMKPLIEPLDRAALRVLLAAIRSHHCVLHVGIACQASLRSVQPHLEAHLGRLCLHVGERHAPSAGRGRTRWCLPCRWRHVARRGCGLARLGGRPAVLLGARRWPSAPLLGRLSRLPRSLRVPRAGLGFRLLLCLARIADLAVVRDGVLVAPRARHRHHLLLPTLLLLRHGVPPLGCWKALRADCWRS
jgi:hypothetical protein